MLFRAFLFAALLMPAWAAAQSATQSATYRFPRSISGTSPGRRPTGTPSSATSATRAGQAGTEDRPYLGRYHAYVLAQEVEFVFSNHLFSPERDQLGWKVFGRRWTPPLQGRSPCRSIRRSPAWRN